MRLTLGGLWLIVFGPRKLPELGRSLGRGIAEFKKATNELQTTLEREVDLDAERTKANEAHAASSDSTTDAAPVNKSA